MGQNVCVIEKLVKMSLACYQTHSNKKLLLHTNFITDCSFLFNTAYAEQGQAAIAAGASSPIATGVDENTRLLLHDHHLLIDREFLQMGEILGGGNFCVNYKFP